jgi:hypothetical protein
MAETAKVRVKEVFHWDRIAAQTREVYQRVWSEYQQSGW